ncbi:4198_t:CDS:2, partial [Scutellospora calospora]
IDQPGQEAYDLVNFKNHAMNMTEKYEKKQEFKIHCYHIERSNRNIRRCILVYEYFRQPELTKSKNSKKETSSKHIECI